MNSASVTPTATATATATERAAPSTNAYANANANANPKPLPESSHEDHEHHHHHHHHHQNHIQTQTSALDGVYNVAFTAHLVAWTVVASALLFLVRAGSVGCRWVGVAAGTLWNVLRMLSGKRFKTTASGSGSRSSVGARGFGACHPPFPETTPPPPSSSSPSSSKIE